LHTSFNWWISNGDTDLDFGPAWEDDGAPGAWTDTYGTPMGDEKKYFVLSNGEFDYDQVFVDKSDVIKASPQVITDRWTKEPLETHKWKVPGETDKTPADFTKDLANGYDTRYLLSWGPLGIFDHIDEAGNRIYRLNPGEKFSMTVAVVAGDNFHDRNNPQPDNENIDPERFNFTSVRYNADWAARVYDNPMIDTPLLDWGNDHDPMTADPDGSQGDGILDTGDGWYGEDVGEDALFAEEVGDVAYKWEGGIRVAYAYPGPDEGENDGQLSQTEDALERPIELDYTRLNEQLDYGDGYPDFKGPPPPDAPQLITIDEPITIVVDTTGVRDSIYSISEEFLTKNVVLKWNAKPSEISQDPFSRELDFEGYRIYVSNTLLEKEFTFVDEFDRVDFSMYSERDSLASKPVDDPNDYPAEEFRNGVRLIRKAVGKNIGFWGHQNLIKDIHENYYYIIRDAHPMVPRYYSVTAYDYGDYKTGTKPLESARIANAVFRAPSGTDKKKVQVVPNPYRADADYTVRHSGISWENRADGTSDFFPQIDRRMYFYNLPEKCLIRIFTLSGDLVTIVPHNLPGDDTIIERGKTGTSDTGWSALYAESWDLNSRNKQQVVAGMYLFTVENSENGDIEVGKFVIIR